MSVLVTVFSSILALVLLGFIGLALWYKFKWLAQPQLFLLAVPYKYAPWTFDPSEAAKLAQLYNGTWGTRDQLETALHNGMHVTLAGYLSDVKTPDGSCGDNPTALYTHVADGDPSLSTACSCGYYIMGTKPSSDVVSGTDYTIQPWNKTTGQWNKYQITSLSGLWKALTGN